MSADFNIAYNPVRTFEGDWCDVPGDKGGETYAGIARAFFPDWHFIDAAKAHPSFQQGSLAFSRHLTTLPNLEDLVTAFYRVQWWDKMGLARWPQLVANELFEQAVNLGRGGSGKLLQRSLTTSTKTGPWGRRPSRPSRWCLNTAPKGTWSTR